MAEADWSELTDGLALSAVRKGVTTGITPPNGGGSFVYGFNSIIVASGAVALFTNQVNFAPMAKGMSVRGVVKRGVSGGPTGFAPFLLAGIQGTSVNDLAYLLGAGDADPYHLVLKKGVISTGLPDLTPDAPNNGILLQSTATFSQDTYHHLRLDMIVNDNGDVLLRVFSNDLAANPLGGAPVWVAVGGMVLFTDDTLQVNSGSAPFTSGRGGFGYHTTDVTRRAFLDHLEVLRQL